jgi:hypothetical protein
MHPQTRNHTKSPPARFSRGGKSRTPKHAAKMPVPASVDENEEELSYVADDLAYLRAERYREADDEELREDEVRSAEAEFAALFKHEDEL